VAVAEYSPNTVLGATLYNLDKFSTPPKLFGVAGSVAGVKTQFDGYLKERSLPRIE
jgi:hypothetical protein